MSLFSKNLRFLRKKGNLNQEDISVLFSKKANTIGNWENQKSEPSLAELIRLAEFFKVPIQDLLHADLEKITYGEAATPGPVPATGSVSRSYPVSEPVNSMANEGSQDAFWLILRELRSMNEKVDTLVTSLETSGSKKNADKSDH